MKKILLFILLITTIGYFNQSAAQCSGANVTITNFAIFPAGNHVNYTFTWQYTHGNASIESIFLCNGTQVGSLPCLPTLKDSAAGPHVVSGSFNTNCSGTFRMEIRIWTNNSCGGTNCSVFREASNSPLPVQFSGFTAQRSQNSVRLTWQTATEINNSGFAVERNVNGNWEQVTFVATQAPAGNSSALLNYSYTDVNTAKGISQYRIRQIDLNGKSATTEIRAVRGIDQPGKTIIYPNPSFDGKVNVVFEDASGLRDVSLVDMNGRLVKQWNGIANNNLQIDNLVPGFYSLRIVVRETGAQSVEKIVINKR